MKKKIYLILFVAITLFCRLYPQVSLSNPQFVFEYDMYVGAIVNFENKLIATNMNKIIEYQILPNGELQVLSFFETRNSPRKPFIDDNYLFVLQESSYTSRIEGLRVFDLSSTPMMQIAFVALDVQRTDNLFFDENYVMISDAEHQRTILIDKTTYEISGFIPDLYGEFILKSEDFLIQPYSKNNDLSLRFIAMDELHNISEISTIDITVDNSYLFDMTLNDTFVVVSTGANITIVDFADIENPFIFSTIPMSHGYRSALMFGEYIYSYTNSANLIVYQIYESGSWNQIFSEYFGITTYRNNIFANETTLYANVGSYLKVFSLIDNFQTIATYGNHITYPNISLSLNDVHLMQRNVSEGTQQIFSVLDNTLLGTLSYDFAYISNVNKFQVIDDKLYVSVMENSSHFLDIYHLNMGNATRMNRIFIRNASCIGLSIINNKIFFKYSNPLKIYAYEILDDEILPIWEGDGQIQFPFASIPTEYIYQTYNNTLNIRDINDLSNILFTRQLNTLPNDATVMHFDDNHFFVSRTTGVTSFVATSYYIDKTQDVVGLIQTFQNDYLSVHGNIFTKNALYSDTNYFYTFLDGNIMSCGELYTDQRQVFQTYFFHERGKAVQIAFSGIWVYDFEYEPVSERETVILPHQTGLWSNYPNPFNPETNIRFSLDKAGDVSIEIFNIRGQKIKTLVDGFMESGEHSVVWHGTDENERNVGSGVYFYRMTAGDVVETRKMVLLK